MFDKIKEECGVFGIFGHPDAAAIVARGLHALQHRGQDAAGIVSFDGARFHSERLAIRASQVGTVAPARAARWGYHRRLALAVSLCADPRLDVLFAPDAPFAALPRVMARLADPADRTLCQRIDYSKES